MCKGRHKVANHKIMANCLSNPPTNLAPQPCHKSEHANSVSFDLTATTTKPISTPQRCGRTSKTNKKRYTKHTHATQQMSPPILPPTKKQPSSSPIGMTEDSDAEMKWKVLNGKVKTGIADAGASASCGQPEMLDSDSGHSRCRH